jgi:DNA-binding response OmpR family regulator
MVILCAEDDVHVKYFIWKLLKADGFTVLTAGDGEVALDVSRNYSGSIDLLLSDVAMPRMNGLELCKLITAERPNTKVLMMSGALGSREQIAMSGLPCLKKPFTATQLLDSIKSLLADSCNDTRRGSGETDPPQGLVS